MLLSRSGVTFLVDLRMRGLDRKANVKAIPIGLTADMQDWF